MGARACPPGDRHGFGDLRTSATIPVPNFGAETAEAPTVLDAHGDHAGWSRRLGPTFRHMTVLPRPKLLRKPKRRGHLTLTASLAAEGRVASPHAWPWPSCGGSSRPTSDLANAISDIIQSGWHF